MNNNRTYPLTLSNYKLVLVLLVALSACSTSRLNLPVVEVTDAKSVLVVSTMPKIDSTERGFRIEGVAGIDEIARQDAEDVRRLVEEIEKANEIPSSSWFAYKKYSNLSLEKNKIWNEYRARGALREIKNQLASLRSNPTFIPNDLGIFPTSIENLSDAELIPIIVEIRNRTKEIAKILKAKSSNAYALEAAGNKIDLPNDTKLKQDQFKLPVTTGADELNKPSGEAVKLIAESDALRQRQREVETQLASLNMSPIKYSKAVNAHALIIGNASYKGSSKLPNPVNDAKAMSSVLRVLGFTVTESLDADRTKLVTALSQFSKTAANADITLLFYAGHGVQISGTNYMLPIDLNLNDLSQVPLQGVSLNSVVEQYLPGKTKLVFLDACRDNPLMQTASRSLSRGLAPINVSEGTLIAYSTKDGQVAQDGDGKNSPFTTALLQHLGDPDDIAVVLRKVREKVMKNTGGKQQPWEYGSLTGGALVLSAIKPIK